MPVIRSIKQGEGVLPVLLMVYDKDRDRAVSLETVMVDGIDETFLGIINFVHEQIHEGNTFSATFFQESVADDGTIDIAVQTGVKELHFIFALQSDGNSVTRLYEGTDFSGDGTPQPIHNKKRSSPTITSVAITIDPTVNNVGTLLAEVFIAGGTGGNATGAVSGPRNEWILLPNTKYLFRMTNIAGGAKTLGACVEWYELNP